jgi:hypothetical protein
VTVRFALALALAAALAGASVGHAQAASGLAAEPPELLQLFSPFDFPEASEGSPALDRSVMTSPESAQGPSVVLGGGPGMLGQSEAAVLGEPAAFPIAAQFPPGGGRALREEATGNDSIEPRVEPAPDGDGLTLSADFEVPLTRALAEAVHRGVPLYFTVEFELYRPRWWWYDELLVERSKTWRLTYHALTRQYRVTADGVIYPFESLDAALRSIVRVRHWRIVAEADALDVEGVFEAQVRLRLDTSQLPKPFQIRGLTNRDWNPQSEWKRFTITLPIPKSAR